MQQLDALCGYLRQEEVDAREISARLVETRDEADPDRISALHEKDRDRSG
jgi:hypothetical protein